MRPVVSSLTVISPILPRITEEEPLSILPLEQMWEESDGAIARVRGDGGAARALVAASLAKGSAVVETSTVVVGATEVPEVPGRRRGLFGAWARSAERE